MVTTPIAIQKLWRMGASLLVTIPKEIREFLELQPGDEVLLLLDRRSKELVVRRHGGKESQ